MLGEGLGIGHSHAVGAFYHLPQVLGDAFTTDNVLGEKSSVSGMAHGDSKSNILSHNLREAACLGVGFSANQYPVPQHEREPVMIPGNIVMLPTD
ncbi:hypothetical protein ES703_40347 [subsurface metagenome]